MFDIVGATIDSTRGILFVNFDILFVTSEFLLSTVKLACIGIKNQDRKRTFHQHNEYIH